MDKNYFKDIPGIGNLHLKEIIESYEQEPIIFFCEDDNGEEYYCHTIDYRFKEDWVIYKISNKKKKNLMKRRTSIREGFKKADHLYYVCSDGTKKRVTFEEVCEFLPKDGVFLRP